MCGSQQEVGEKYEGFNRNWAGSSGSQHEIGPEYEGVSGKCCTIVRGSAGSEAVV